MAILGLRVHAARMKAAATALMMLLAVRGSQCSANLLSVPLSVVARSVVRDGSYAWTTRRGSTMKSGTEPHRARLRGAYRAPIRPRSFGTAEASALCRAGSVSLDTLHLRI